MGAGCNFSRNAFVSSRPLISCMLSLTSEKLPECGLLMRSFFHTIKMRDYFQWTKMGGIYNLIRLANRSLLIEAKLYIPEELYREVIITIIVPYMLKRAYIYGKYARKLSNTPIEAFLQEPTKKCAASVGIFSRLLDVMEGVRDQENFNSYKGKVEMIFPKSFTEGQGKCVEFEVKRANPRKTYSFSLLFKNIKTMTQLSCGTMDTDCFDFFLKLLSAHITHSNVIFIQSEHSTQLLEKKSNDSRVSLDVYNPYRSATAKYLVTCVKMRGLWHYIMFERTTSIVHYSSSLSLTQDIGPKIGNDDISELKLFLGNFTALLNRWKSQDSPNGTPVVAKKFVMSSQTLRYTKNKKLIPGNFADLSGAHCLKLCFGIFDSPDMFASPLQILPFGDINATSFHILLLKILQKLILKHGNESFKESLTECEFDEDENNLVYKFSL